MPILPQLVLSENTNMDCGLQLRALDLICVHLFDIRFQTQYVSENRRFARFKPRAPGDWLKLLRAFHGLYVHLLIRPTWDWMMKMYREPRYLGLHISMVSGEDLLTESEEKMIFGTGR